MGKYLVWGILLLSSAVQADAPLLQASYHASYHGFDLELVRTLTPLGENRFRFESRADSALARIEESSVFRRGDGDAWFPERYRYTQSIFGITRRYELTFDTGSGTVTYRKGDHERRMQVPAGTLDPLLYQLRLQYDLARHRDTYSYRFLRHAKLKTYRFVVAGHDTLSVGNRKVQAIRLKKQDDNPDHATQIWFTPDNGYQLIRLSYTDDDSTYRIDLDTVKAYPGFEAWLTR